ncbi:hypothetical protein AVEN_67938-1 [Araneus ventricosus]|uniref:Uncharacterized protein n=1 Tax=Araneus ventricosus TaxID=182803 RepID=A0A4Y2QMF9_ARAVE|nr:hypothetical protein AVEN_67938-1 [Araneus ventricosus]
MNTRPLSLLCDQPTDPKRSLYPSPPFSLPPTPFLLPSLLPSDAPPRPRTICHSHSLSIFFLFAPLRLSSSFVSAAFALSPSSFFPLSLALSSSVSLPRSLARSGSNCVGEIRLTLCRWRSVQARVCLPREARRGSLRCASRAGAVGLVVVGKGCG